MDRLVMVLIGVNVLFFALLVFLFVLLAGYRLREVKKKEAIEHYIDRHQQDWYDCLIQGRLPAENLQPAGFAEMEAIDSLFFRFKSNFSSQTMNKEMQRFAMLYMEDYYVGQLKSKKWSVRMNALHKVYGLEWTFMLGNVQEMVRADQTYSREEYLLMYRIIAKLAPEEFLDYIVKPKVKFGEFDFRKLLVELEEPQLQILADEFKILPFLLQLTLVEIIGVRFYFNWLPFLQERLDSEEQELRIRALKSIAALGLADDPDIYAKFIESPVWEERLMVAKIYRAAPADEAEQALKKLITDSSYPVRAQAAASMRALKNGQQALYSVIRTSPDGFAVDLAEEMIGKESRI